MKTVGTVFATRKYRPHVGIIMLWLGLLCTLTLSACGRPVTPLPIPTIVPAHPCTLQPGDTIPLVVTGIAGPNILYTWSASAGLISPPNNSTVNFTAPQTGGDVIIKVVTQSGSQSSEAFITCSIVVAPTATPTATPAPTPTETPTPTTTPAPTQTPSPCQGSNSPELIAKTWAALGTNDANMALACAETIIANYSADADAQQAERMVVPAGKTENTCTSAVPTDGKNAGVVKEFNGKYWALDDVATAWFLRGEALMKLGKTADAITSYQAVLNKYACAYAWDPKNFWFWNVANAAKQKIPPSLLASPTATP